MIKNYFFLKRFAAETARELAGLNAVSVFSQEKDKILFEFSPGNFKESRFMEISVNPGNPYLTIKKNYSRAKKNTLDFFNGYFPSGLISIEIAESDRVIRFKFEPAWIYFTVRGKYTNVVLISNEGEVSSFKKAEQDFLNSFFTEVNKIKFIDPAAENHFDFEALNPENFIEKIKKNYPVISKEILQEINLRNPGNSKEKFINEIRNIAKEINKGTPAVFINRETGETRLAVNSFKLFEEWDIYRFDNLKDAVNFYLGKKHHLEGAAKDENLIRKNIEKELARLSGKLNNIKSRLERGNREEEFNRTANLLLININSLKKGADSIEIEDLYNTNEKIRIKLNPELSPLANADHYFQLSKKEKVSFAKTEQMYKELKMQFEELKKKKKELEKIKRGEENTDSYKQLKKELKIKEVTQSTADKPDISEKFKHYILENKYHVYVGKDSVNNDLLTTKFARQNDYWFHARGVSGSHLVLKVSSSSEKIPKNILKAAAAIAAFHSKAKTSGLAPVSFTQKKYVVKKKGMEPGKVALLREEVLIVKPGIPKNAEYVFKNSE